MTQKLIVNADDFGRSSPINQGIIEGHQKGVVTSASLMTEREGFDEKSALKKAARELGLKRDEAYRLMLTQKNRRSK